MNTKINFQDKSTLIPNLEIKITTLSFSIKNILYLSYVSILLENVYLCTNSITLWIRLSEIHLGT